MANICDNRFYFRCEKNYNLWLTRFKGLFNTTFDGEINWYSESDENCQEDGSFEGWFESRWNFPNEIFEKLFKDYELENEDIYFRCLSEEYGMGYVAMNIYQDNHFKDEQCFDL